MNNGRQRLVEDWSGDEDDTSFFIELRGGDVDSQQSPWCRKCSASGRMSGLERESWSRSGYCETMGCPGYSGHPPASRPQGEFMTAVPSNSIISLSGLKIEIQQVLPVELSVVSDLACGLWCGDASQYTS